MIYDHLGNEYDDLMTMLNKYGISKATYYNRIKRGWNIEDILTKEVKKKYYNGVSKEKINKLKKLITGGSYFD